MKEIPKIIHQIWSGVDEPLPERAQILGKTWQEHYPDWKYELWDNARMENFIKTYYPQHWDVYSKYPYNVQRWDAIRYLILDKIGGMYADFDYESIEPMGELIEGKSCCFAKEPESHLFLFKRRYMFNNALMLSVPGHPFMKKIIETVFDQKMLEMDSSSKNFCVMNTTGPWILMNLYAALTDEEKKDIYLIPAKFVSPLDSWQAWQVMNNETNTELEEALEPAYAVHYYLSDWRKTSN